MESGTTVYQEKRAPSPAVPLMEYHYVDSRHPRYQMPLHWHMECELIRVQSGQLVLQMNQSSCVLNPGDAALVAGGTVHGGQVQDAVYECLVHTPEPFWLTGGEEGRQLAENPELLQRVYLKSTPVAQLAEKLFCTQRSSCAGTGLITAGLLLQLYGEAMACYGQEALASGKHFGSGEKLKPLKAALRLIRKEYMQPLTLEQLAAVAGMSPRYFCRYFAGFTQRTPVEYLNYYRIECACAQLLTTGDTITDVALENGFNDVSYFIKAFRRCKGCTPGQFRRQNREGK